jgi:hypothetical protein
MGNRGRWHICPYCKKKFPLWYWGITGKTGGCGKIKKRGLARANFNRHKTSCSIRNPIKIVCLLIQGYLIYKLLFN